MSARASGVDRVAPWLVLIVGIGGLVALVASACGRGSWLAALAMLVVFVAGATAVERRLRRARPFEAHGRLARWTHPSKNPLGWIADVLANSRLLSAWVEPLPIAPMVSDIRDVIYVNYLVPAERLAACVPWGLELERVGPGGAWALFSFLTYRHGHFGFRFLGPLRRLLPSPVQTNWRVHVRDPRTGTRGIYFVTNAIDDAPPALAARLFTEGMPMHVFARSRIERSDATGRVSMEFDPGEGSAPRASAELSPCDAPTLEGPWREAFGDWQGFLNYCVPQNRAMSGQPWLGRVTRHEITLPIDTARCQPLAGSVTSETARAIVGDAAPLCFRVEGLFFTFEAELHDPVPERSPRADSSGETGRNQ